MAKQYHPDSVGCDFENTLQCYAEYISLTDIIHHLY